jgi:hypothetical protein
VCGGGFSTPYDGGGMFGSARAPIFTFSPLNKGEDRPVACPTGRVLVPDGYAVPFIFGRVHGVLAVRVFE